MNVSPQDLERMARAARLLVATDYDGVLAAIAPRPELAATDPVALGALAALAALENTWVAVISGRAWADLASRVGAHAGIRLIGSHGVQTDSEARLTPSQTGLRDRLARELQRIAADSPGLLAESKPFGAALHYRLAAPADARTAVDRVLAEVACLPDVHLRQGKEVLELAVVSDNKGAALARLKAELGADATVFIGDDLTDEDAFAVLGDSDLGVKVGPGETVASRRIADPHEAAALLARLAELRSLIGN